MHTFKDKNGDDWDVELTLFGARAIEGYDFGPALHEDEEVYIDFLPPQEDLFQKYLPDPNVCFAMIWVLCKDQAEPRGIKSEYEFARLFNGDTLFAAQQALHKELPDFFPRLKTTLTTLLEQLTKVHTATDKLMREKVLEVVPDDKIEEIVAASLGTLSSSLQANSDETGGQ